MKKRIFFPKLQVRNKNVRFLIFLCVSFLSVDSLAGDFNDITSAQKEFVSHYIQAINSKDENQLKELMNPKVVACMDAFNQDYFFDMFQRTLRYNIPEEYKVSIKILSEEDITQEVEGAKQFGLSYPVNPTHQMQIDFNTDKFSSVTILRKLVQDGEAFYEALGCPSKAAVERFREMRIKKDAEQLRAKKLFQELKDPLLSELIKLLRAGKKIEAWKKYSEVKGESLATAKEVLSHIGEGSQEDGAFPASAP